MNEVQVGVEAGVVGVVKKSGTPVTTTLGTVDQTDLVQKVETTDLPDQIVVAREWVYAGSDPRFVEHVGKMVRRDVWVTVKHGLAAAGVQGV